MQISRASRIALAAITAASLVGAATALTAASAPRDTTTTVVDSTSQPTRSTIQDSSAATPSSAPGAPLLSIDVGAPSPPPDLLESYSSSSLEDPAAVLEAFGFGADAPFPILVNAVLHQIEGSTSGPTDAGTRSRAFIAVFALAGTEADLQRIVDAIAVSLRLSAEHYDIVPSTGVDGTVDYATIAATPTDPSDSSPAWSVQANHDPNESGVVRVTIERDDQVPVEALLLSTPLPTDHQHRLDALVEAGLGEPTDSSFVRGGHRAQPIVLDTFGFVAVGAPETVAGTACGALGLSDEPNRELEGALFCESPDGNGPDVRVDIEPDPSNQGFSRVLAQFMS